MIDPDNLPKPTYVNAVALSGFMNGTVNISLSSIRWYPSDYEGTPTVAKDETIEVDLRMDLYAATRLRDALDSIIEENTKPKVAN